MVGAAPLLRGSGVAYDSQSATAKLQYLWSNVVADRTSHPWPSLLELAKVYVESMSPTVTYVSDEFPEGRSKLIHSVAAIAQCQFAWNGSGNYTGLFRQADMGLCRLSSALQPDTDDTDDTTDAEFIPAAGFKFLRDGVHSGNFMAMCVALAACCASHRRACWFHCVTRPLCTLPPQVPSHGSRLVECAWVQRALPSAST